MTRKSPGAAEPWLCLASASAIRRQILDAAGARFDVDPADIDEEAVVESDPDARAITLARLKAMRVSERRPRQLVLGSDQVLESDGRLLTKPESIDEAEAQLRLMNGRTHVFHCGIALFEAGARLFEGVDRAAVTLHRLSDAEIEAYAASGEGVGCAGAYRLEAGGSRLIAGIVGSHFTVLGLPLLLLVEVLRRKAVFERAFPPY